MTKRTKKVELKEVARIELGNGSILVKYEDGSYKIITEVVISEEQASEIFGSDEDDEEDDEEDDDEDDEDDEEDVEKLRSAVAKELGIKLPKAAKGKGKKKK